MKLTIKVLSALCALQEFEVNGIEADEDDFVSKYDHSPDTSEDYCCGDMRADISLPEPEVLEKYNISLEEFKEIAERVAEKLDFGCCGWCM